MKAQTVDYIWALMSSSHYVDDAGCLVRDVSAGVRVTLRGHLRMLDPSRD